MRTSLLDFIKCPACEQTNFILDVENENSVEIRSGKLTCKSCKSIYPITNGIINLLGNPRIEIASEQKGWVELNKKIGTYEQEIVEQLAMKLPDVCSLNNDNFREAWQPVIVNFNSALSILNLQGNERILDVGAGRCWTTKTFAKFGCKTIAFDILDDDVLGLGAADKILSKNLYFERSLGDMEKLPFRDKIFDIVFSTGSIHHSDICKSIPETLRVLKSGGRLVLINEPTISGGKRFAKLESEEQKAGISEHVYLLEEYTSMVRNNGASERIYYPPGALFSIRRILRTRAGQKHFSAKKIAAYLLLKTRIVNRITLQIFWRLAHSNPNFGLFLIATKK